MYFRLHLFCKFLVICVRSWKPGTQVVPGAFWVIHIFWNYYIILLLYYIYIMLLFPTMCNIWKSDNIWRSCGHLNVNTSQKLKGRKSLSKDSQFSPLSPGWGAQWCSFASHLDKPYPLSRTVSGLAGQKVVWTMVIKSIKCWCGVIFLLVDWSELEGTSLKWKCFLLQKVPEYHSIMHRIRCYSLVL